MKKFIEVVYAIACLLAFFFIIISAVTAISENQSSTEEGTTHYAPWMRTLR